MLDRGTASGVQRAIPELAAGFCRHPWPHTKLYPQIRRTVGLPQAGRGHGALARNPSTPYSLPGVPDTARRSLVGTSGPSRKEGSESKDTATCLDVSGALGTVAFRPMVLIGGPGAAHLDRHMWLSLFDEIVATASHFEYAASGIDFGIVRDAEAARLRQLMRRVLVVDIETAARGLPRDSQGLFFESPGFASVTALANRTRAFAVSDNSESWIADYCRGGSSLVVLIWALPPSRVSMTGGLQLGSIPPTRQRATMISQASGPTRDERLIQISQRTQVGK